MVTPIRAILKSAARAWGLEPAAHLAGARAVWLAIVGPDLAAHSAPVGVRGKRLLVGVTHPAAGQEIRLRSGVIIQALARELGEGAIAEVLPVPRRTLHRPRTRRSS